MKVTIDLSKLQVAADNAGEIVLDSAGEKNLLELLEAREKLDQLIDQAKVILEEKALALNPNLTTIIGQDIKVSYRYFGKKFDVVPGLEKSVPEDILKRTIRYDVDSKGVESYEQEHGTLPEGVMVRNRKKVITFKRVGEADEE